MEEFNLGNRGVISLCYQCTLACNNRCPFCYNLGILDNAKSFNHGAFDKFKISFNNLKRDKLVELMLVGGEPLFLSVEDLSRFRELDLDNTFLSIRTNLNFEWEHLVERLNIFKDIKINLVASFYFGKNEDLITSNILKINSLENVDIEVAFVLEDDNQENILEKARFLLDKGIVLEQIIPCGLSLGDKKKLRKMSQECYALLGLNPDDQYILSDLPLSNLMLCEPSCYNVFYDGTYQPICHNGDRRNVEDGFVIKPTVCTSRFCGSDTFSYRKIVRRKNVSKV